MFAVSTLMLAPGRAAAQDSVDVPADPAYALCPGAENVGSISLPHYISASLEPDAESTRVDFYRFESEPGLELRASLAVEHAFADTTVRDPLLGLFDADCERLDFNDNVPSEDEVDLDLDARLDFVVPDDGVFILAAATAPDSEFDGSSEDTGIYALSINFSPWARPLEPPATRVARAADGRIDVELTGFQGSGYNVYRDGRYVTTVRPGRGIGHFRLDGIAGDYCIVAFIEHERGDRYSPCGDLFSIGPDGVLVGPPSAPRALRGTIHSPGVAELHWRAAVDDGHIVAYRLRRDGAELAGTTGLSRYEPDLEPTRTYRFAVTAVDDAGLEGPPAYLDIRPVAAAQVPPMPSGGPAPQPPGPISGTLYSSGTVEIFWERSSHHGSLAGYEVTRDGQRVAFHKGLSHFEARVPTDADHLYAVVAVGREGARSTPRRLRFADSRFTALDHAPSTAIIRRDTHAELIAHAFDVYVGDLYSPTLHALSRLETRLQDIEVGRDMSANPILFQFDCGDGRADLALLFSGTNFGEIYDWTFEDCSVEGLTYDGTLNLHENARGPTFRSPGLELRRTSDIGTRFSGMAQWWNSQTAFFDRIGSWDTEGLALSARTIDGDLEIIDSTSRFAYGYRFDGRFEASLGGGFAIRSDLTEGSLLRASVPVTLRYERGADETLEPANAWNFTSGQLRLVAEDGSRLLLDADTGDEATVRITIDNERGPDTFTTLWTPWQPRLRFDRYPLDAPDRIVAPSARPDATAGPAITPENYPALLDQAFGLYAGADYAGPLALARSFVASDDVLDTVRDRGVRTDRIACEDGGTATVRRIDDADGEPVDYRIDFDACDTSTYLLVGQVRGSAPVTTDEFALESDNLTWLDGDGVQSRLLGRASRQGPDVTDGSCAWRSESVTVYGLADDPEAILVTSGERSYVYQDETGTRFFTLEAAGTRFETSVDGTLVLLEGGLRFVSDTTGGHALRVLASGLTTRSPDGAASAPDGAFVSGGLFMEAEDGSRLYLGDFVASGSGASVVIVNREGRFEITEPWTSWRKKFDTLRQPICQPIP